MLGAENRKRISRNIILILLLLSPFLVPHSNGSPTPTPVLTGLNFPASLTRAADGRIFFNEKNTGNIRIIHPNGTLQAAPFATVTPLFTGGESGLLGLVLDPSFSSNGHLYAYYTDRDSQSFTRGHIRRYTAVGNVGTAPVDIFSVTSSAPNTVYHNGGYLKFGPDRNLYATVGEFHQSQSAQDPSTTDGKMLRMKSDGTPPGDNPDPSSLVYASGIRNSYGFDFDTSNGRLIATEAGPTSDDEINIITKGGNYGWPTCLGVCSDPRFIDPVVDINPIVTPTGIASIAPNVYYFGEYNTGDLVRLELNPTGGFVSMSTVYSQSGGIVAVEADSSSLVYFATPDAIYAYQVGSTAPAPSLTFFTLFLIGIVGIAVASVTIVYLAAHCNRQSDDAHFIPKTKR